MHLHATRKDEYLPKTHPLSNAIARCLTPGRASVACAVGICATLLVGGSPGAATFTVTNTNDAGPGSLREAVGQANAKPGADVVLFDSIVSGSITLTTGPITATDNIVVEGPGSDVLSVDNDIVSVVGDAFTAEISGLSMQGVSVRATDLDVIWDWQPPTAVMRDCRIADAGLALYAANAELRDSTVSGGGVTGDYAIIFFDPDFPPSGYYVLGSSVIAENTTIVGGGVEIVGDVDIKSSAISGAEGSALSIRGGSARISDSILTENGGGINQDNYRFARGSLAIERTAITGNRNRGVFFYSYDSETARISSSVISGNGQGGVSVVGYRGAQATIENTLISGNGDQGLLVSRCYNSSITNSTVSGNTGDGIMARDCRNSFDVRNSTIVNNFSGLNVAYCPWESPYGITVTDSIISGSKTTDTTQPDYCYLPSISSTFSLISELEDGSVAEAVPGSNIFGKDPLLGPLQDNGGPTLTHALLLGSPAIDAGDPYFTPPPDFDQRGEGFVRVYNGRIDMGAFELQPMVQPVGALTADHQWTDLCGSDLADAVILLGPPTHNGGDPGVARMQATDDVACPYQVRFAEWDYRARDFNDLWHKPEQISYLGLTPGVYTMDDGSVWEVGSFENWGNGVWKTVSFQNAFAGTPTLFLTIQTANGTETTTARARNVAPESFDAAMFEEEYLMSGGHATETIGYVAIYHPDADTSASVEGIAMINGAEIPYALQRNWVNQNWTSVDDIELHLEEEQSLDDEVAHKDEMVDVLTIGDQVFAQQVSSYGQDTTAIRRR